jgi:hypothetical protein
MLRKAKKHTKRNLNKSEALLHQKQHSSIEVNASQVHLIAQ